MIGYMMNKILLIISGILAVACFILFFMYNLSQNKIYTLETKILSLKSDVSKCNENLSDCNKGIEEFNNAQIRASDTIQQIKTVVKTVKSDCECFNASVEPAILNVVRKQK